MNDNYDIRVAIWYASVLKYYNRLIIDVSREKKLYDHDAAFQIKIITFNLCINNMKEVNENWIQVL